MNKYPSYRYNDDFVLKVSPLLMAVIFYSLRHLVFILLAYNPSQKMGSLDFLRHQFDPWLVISDMPALLLTYAWANRRVGMPAKAKAIWRRGRELLIASVGLNVGLMLWLSGHDILRSPVSAGLPVLLQSLLDACVLLYLFRSNLVRDIFADLPRDDVKRSKPR
jgi:hypothetical protein